MSDPFFVWEIIIVSPIAGPAKNRVLAQIVKQSTGQQTYDLRWQAVLYETKKYDISCFKLNHMHLPASNVLLYHPTLHCTR